MRTSVFFVPIILVTLTGCPDPIEGCTDGKALNTDYDAEKNDGSCEYSTATFYAKFGFYQGIPVNGIDVSVNGNDMGTISAVYPGGPGNCYASGTVQYQFASGKSISWNTTVYLANGATIFGSGSLSPNSLGCITVNVTK